MAYVLLIVEAGDRREQRVEGQGHHEYDRMVGWARDLTARGVLKATESLRSEGVRVESRGGKRTIVDGPFAEAKEMVGGFFLLDVPTREQAIAIASECPAVEWATVEVRETGPCHDQ